MTSLATSAAVLTYALHVALRYAASQGLIPHPPP